MQFNQTNNNHGGDVNNIIAEEGNIVQSTGDRTRLEVDKPKSGFWSEAWTKIISVFAWFGWTKRA